MNHLLAAMPTILAGVVVVVIALRAVRQARRETERGKAELALRRQEFDRRLAELEATHGPSPAGLVMSLDLADDDPIPGLRLASEQTEPLVSALSRQEQELGGAGLTLTEARVGPGAIRLTLSPIDRSGSAERVRRVADQVNAAGAPLPPGVTAARADVTAV